jgi:hypothetical protein
MRGFYATLFGLTHPVFIIVVIEELKKGKNLGTLGVLLSDSFEPDLSHASILYYYRIFTTLYYMNNAHL